MISKNRSSLPPFVSGQVWQLADSNLQIGVVGKTLVHYKHFKGQARRAPISLALKEVLEKYLRVNKAVLV
jgi:hypothetical protein